MEEHGLTDWSFRFSRGKRQLGYCREQTKTIALSLHYIQLNDEAHVRDTILHEIAHALAGHANGHNAKWKAVCRRIGANPQRLDRKANVPDAPYEMFCTICRTVLGPGHRRARADVLARTYCRHCGRKSAGKVEMRVRSAKR